MTSPLESRRSIEALWQKWVVEPVKNNPIPSVLILGVFLVVVGAVLPTGEDARFAGWAASLLKSMGLTILGAGVFAFLLKTSQFAEHFRSILLDVLYDPASLS